MRLQSPSNGRPTPTDGTGCRGPRIETSRSRSARGTRGMPQPPSTRRQLSQIVSWASWGDAQTRAGRLWFSRSASLTSGTWRNYLNRRGSGCKHGISLGLSPEGWRSLIVCI
jgi:hypothetical protein